VLVALTQSFEDCEALQDPVEAAGGVSRSSSRFQPFQTIELFALDFDFLLDCLDELVEVTAHSRFSVLSGQNAYRRMKFPYGASRLCVAENGHVARDGLKMVRDHR
jgi:hypothetical protein